jgi:hypothetical protein
MRIIFCAFFFSGWALSLAAREPSHRFQGYYRGYLEQYAAAELRENANETVAVIGYVKRPGTIEPREGLTLTNALDESGGFTDWADHHHVGIWRDGEGRFVAVNVYAIERKEVDDPLLYKGDIVIVTGRWMSGIEPQSKGKHLEIARVTSPSKLFEAAIETNEWPDTQNTSSPKVQRRSVWFTGSLV